MPRLEVADDAASTLEPTTKPREPVADRPVVIGDDGTIGLQASRCRCGELYVPARSFCPSCGLDDLVSEVLTGGGSLYSYAVVRVSASRPVPYILGYVDLDAGARVLADVITPDPDRLVPDTRVRLVANGPSDWAVTPVESGDADD